jgi:hypothetical protein
MIHADPDYDAIQDTATARQLAALVLSQHTGSGPLRRLAAEVLGIEESGLGLDKQMIAAGDRTSMVPFDEPVFLIRGQDIVGGEAVRAWADLAEKAGASADILRAARDHAARMDAWRPKKVPDARPAARASEAAKPAVPPAEPPAAAAKPAMPAAESPARAAAPEVLRAEPPTATAERDRLRPVAFMMHQYTLQPRVPIDDVNRDGFWDPLADLLVPGDVLFVTAALPDGSTLTEMRSVAHVSPFVRVRKMR